MYYPSSFVITTLNDEMKRTMLLNGSQIRCWMKVGDKIDKETMSHNLDKNDISSSGISDSNSSTGDDRGSKSNDSNSNSNDSLNSNNNNNNNNSSSSSGNSGSVVDKKQSSSSPSSSEKGIENDTDAGTATALGTGIGRMMTVDVTDLMGSEWRLMR